MKDFKSKDRQFKRAKIKFHHSLTNFNYKYQTYLKGEVKDYLTNFRIKTKIFFETIIPSYENYDYFNEDIYDLSCKIIEKSSGRGTSYSLLEKLEEKRQKGKDLLLQMQQKHEQQLEKNPLMKNKTMKFLQKSNKLDKKKEQRLMKRLEVKSQCRIKLEKIRQSALVLLQSGLVEVIMSLSTIYCLYADDIRQYAFTQKDDDTFFSITFVCFILFFLDCFFSCFLKDKYFLTFQFYMDFVSTISLIFDIPWLSEAVFGTSFDGSQVSFLKAGRITRVTARATRVVRFIKLIRIIRVGKLYKHAFENINKRVMSIIEQEKEEKNQEEEKNEIDKFRKSIDESKKHSILQIKQDEKVKDVNETRSKEVKLPYNQEQRKSQFMNERSYLDVNQNDTTLAPLKVNFMPSKKHIQVKTKKQRDQENSQDFNSFEHTLFHNYGGVQVSSVNPVKSKFRKSPDQSQHKIELGSLGAKRFQVSQDSIIGINFNQISNQYGASSNVNQSFQVDTTHRNNNQNNYTENSPYINTIGSHYYSNFDQVECTGQFDSLELDNDEDNLLDVAKNHQKQDIKNDGELFEQNTQQHVETKIGRQLSDITTQRVILLIFSLVLSVPIFSESTWVTDDVSFDTGLKQIKDFSSTDDQVQQQLYDTKIVLNQYITYHQNYDRYQLLWLQLGNTTIYMTQNNFDLRNSEKGPINYSSTSRLPVVEGVYSYKADSDLTSLLSIIQTTFLIVLLSLSSYYFAKDASEVLVDPIERMLTKIQRISSNPLEAARLAEDEAIAEEELKSKGQSNMDNQFETHILESTIIKIGALLALGFGEAGSEIIAKNMNKDGLVNPMIPGRKVLAIFGFVAIRNFADATEVLEEKVMLFANEIAEIVHNVCDAFHGVANKNLGDCFLMVWKYKESDEIIHLNKDEEVCTKNLSVCQNFTDLALLGFLKTISNSYKLGQTKRFSRHARQIQQTNPTFMLKLGFGLHVGWGIEGSIGSQFKIDASYLSPNVNMASRLENATKQYGLQLLISGAVYNLLSTVLQNQMRHVDRVTVKGSKQPMDLYTCDLDPQLMNVSQPEIKVKVKEKNKKIFRFVNRKKKDKRYDKIISGKIQVCKLFENDQDFIIMRQNYTKDFIETFHEGISYYLDGYWEEANQYFQSAQNILTQNIIENSDPDNLRLIDDGPIKTLTNYMKYYNFESPESWRGFRELKDK